MIWMLVVRVRQVMVVTIDFWRPGHLANFFNLTAEKL